MNNFGRWLTPEEAFEKHNHQPPLTLEELREFAKDDRKCLNCGEHVWRFVDTGLCFSCTTGETDASDDYEIGEPY